MRIQHNILAMNAYRNYNNNTSALSKNLEKLSSGYKINRAGDDAAGLAISEKMRAQITGLSAASKNVKDGISLVKTAEGAMQEIQDMLNRMDYLATQSANGTYDNEVDRAALQKEVDQLKSEINRIADSANFNGIKLLDGSLDVNDRTNTIAGKDRMLEETLGTGEDQIENIGKKTILDTEGIDTPVKTVFSVDFNKLSVNGAAEGATPPTTTVKGTIAASEAAATAKAATVGKTGTETGETDTGNADTVALTSGTDVAKALEGAEGFSSVNTGAATDVKLKYTAAAGDDPEKWEISVGAASVEVDVAVDAGVMTVSDKDGNELFTVTSNDTTNKGAITDFQTAYTTAANTGIQYTAAAKVAVGGTDTSVTATAGDALTAALAENGDATDGEEIKLDYGATTAGKWTITTTTDTTGVEADSAELANGVLTLKDADGNELLSVNVGDTASMSALQTGYGTSAKGVGLEYKTAATTSAQVAGADASFEAGTALADALADVADGDVIKVEYNDTDDKWTITSTNDSTGIDAASAEFDAAAGTMTLKDADGKTLLTITADPASASVTAFQDGFKAANNSNNPVATNLVYSAAEDGGTEVPDPDAAGKTTMSLTLDGKELATDVEINVGDGAEAIASAVFAALEDGDGDDTNGIQVTLDNGATYTVTNANGKLTFSMDDDPDKDTVSGNFDWNVEINGGKFAGTHNAGTTVETAGAVEDLSTYANTVFEVGLDDIKNGTTISIEGKSVTIQIDGEEKVKAAGANGTVVTLTKADAKDIDRALSKIVEGFKDGTDNLKIGVNNGGNGDEKVGISVSSKRPGEDSVKKFKTREELASVFRMTTPAAKGEDAKALTLQIGDTADSYNQMKVSIGDMHATAMGIADIDISNQEGASAAIETIKNAINYVSSVRGDLGATQNRLEHTANNLSVMAENIQDAESTIRDTDVAEEMMSYVKNNILVQSAQAMLAQANQVPQGVLQLLG